MAGRNALRRLGSFQRMDRVAKQADSWFHTDPGLAAVIDGYAAEHCDAFAEQQGGPDECGGKEGWYLFAELCETVDEQQRMGEALHRRKELFDDWVRRFDAQLTAWVGSEGVSRDEFQQVFEMAQREEERYGKTFYRWSEAGDYGVWLRMMHEAHKQNQRCGRPAAADWLRRDVVRMSSDAKVALRRRKALRPLLDAWRPSAFEDVRGVVMSFSTPDRLLQKTIVRWQLRCTEPVPGRDGVYRPPELSAERLARFLGAASESMDEEAFAAFVEHLRRHVEEAPMEGAAATRRCVSALHRELDRNWNGEAELSDISRVLRAAGMAESKGHRKLMLKWEAQMLQQRQQQPPCLDEDADKPNPLNLDELCTFVGELVAVDGERCEKRVEAVVAELAAAAGQLFED
eukprot:TRINITY_DN22735_c0_g1_i1.p1 TRINITY_DN22735_c0_g1~~TRINITY_DN22735_c0_g1_i1.p1  ORF type:complete len:402 (+),score=135.39 TRINITY_DN22735_c0_g1_i1:62-1267(+)